LLRPSGNNGSSKVPQCNVVLTSISFSLLHLIPQSRRLVSSSRFLSGSLVTHRSAVRRSESNCFVKEKLKLKYTSWDISANFRNLSENCTYIPWFTVIALYKLTQKSLETRCFQSFVSVWSDFCASLCRSPHFTNFRNSTFFHRFLCCVLFQE